MQRLLASCSRFMSTHSTPSPLPTLAAHKVLIANRGEVAIRVARTLELFRIPSVAVYATDDFDSLHVRRCNSSHTLSVPGTAAYACPSSPREIVSLFM